MFVVCRSQFPLFLCIKMVPARFQDSENIGEEEHAFKVFKKRRKLQKKKTLNSFVAASFKYVWM